MKLPTFVQRCVAPVYAGTSSGVRPVGTAFLVDVGSASRKATYLVTCKHVVKPSLDQGARVYLRLNRRNSSGIDFLELSEEWILHDSQDVAVLAWTSPSHVLEAAPAPTISARRVRRRLIREGAEILFVGIWHEDEGRQRNMPILRFGRVALVIPHHESDLEESYPMAGDWVAKRRYLLECQAYAGNSGSPVFAAPSSDRDAPITMIGMMTASFPERREVAYPGGTIQVYTHFGLSSALPIDEVRSFLMSIRNKSFVQSKA